uniref:Uncharacterized protein n=1 Tax=Moniliophthora roreri TaxID=221103 RepID=A0A0W0EVL6_MONRR
MSHTEYLIKRPIKRLTNSVRTRQLRPMSPSGISLPLVMSNINLISHAPEVFRSVISKPPMLSLPLPRHKGDAPIVSSKAHKPRRCDA